MTQSDNEEIQGSDSQDEDQVPHLIKVVQPQVLENKIQEATDIDPKYEDANGDMKEFDQNTKNYMIKRSVSDTLAEYIADQSIIHPMIDDKHFKIGSGHTGRASKLNLVPKDSVSMEQLKTLAEQLDEILQSGFPTDYIVGVAPAHGVDEDGYPTFSDEDYYIFLRYSVRTATPNLQAPPGEDSVIISK